MVPISNGQYYLEKNLEARAKELEREAELEEKAPKVKAKSKMSKVSNTLVIPSFLNWGGNCHMVFFTATFLHPLF